jgi:hypothetical protein
VVAACLTLFFPKGISSPGKNKPVPGRCLTHQHSPMHPRRKKPLCENHVPDTVLSAGLTQSSLTPFYSGVLAIHIRYVWKTWPQKWTSMNSFSFFFGLFLRFQDPLYLFLDFAQQFTPLYF